MASVTTRCPVCSKAVAVGMYGHVRKHCAPFDRKQLACKGGGTETDLRSDVGRWRGYAAP